MYRRKASFRKPTIVSPWKARTGLTLAEIEDLAVIAAMEGFLWPEDFIADVIRDGNRRAYDALNGVEMAMLLIDNQDRCEDDPYFAVREASSCVDDMEYTTQFEVLCHIDPTLEHRYRDVQEALQQLSDDIANAQDDLESFMDSEQ